MLRVFAATLCVLMVMLLVGGVTESFWKGLLLGGGMSVATIVTLILFALRLAKTIEERDAEGASPLQFRISTLLILITLQGFYLAAIREVILSTRYEAGSGLTIAIQVLVWAAFLGLGMCLPWLILTEFIMSFLARAVRTPWGRRLVRLLYRPRGAAR